MTNYSFRAALVAGALAVCSPASAAVVSFSGSIFNSCVLTISTPGTLALSANGQVFGSEQTGGIAAVMAVLAIGNVPSINFAAPSMTASPAGYSGSPTVEIRYSALSGATQGYTSNASSVTSGRIDTFTVHGRLTESSGFNAGTYTMTTVATCQQN